MEKSLVKKLKVGSIVLAFAAFQAFSWNLMWETSPRYGHNKSPEEARYRIPLGHEGIDEGPYRGLDIDDAIPYAICEKYLIYLDGKRNDRLENLRDNGVTDQ
jgi:hypothetical protein